MTRRRRIDPELLDRALREPEGTQEELEDLLRVSRALTEAFEATPRPDAVEAGRIAAISAFEAAGDAPALAPVRVLRPRMTSPYEWLPQLRVRALATAAIVIGVLGALVAGAHGSLPGDALYGVKLGVEEVRLVAAIDSIDEAKVHLDVAEARIEEVVRAKELGRSDAMRESLRRYTEAIVAVEQELASGDLSTNEARLVLAEAAGTFELQEELLTDLRPGTPAPAKPDLETAIDVLKAIELPPAEEPADDEPSPGPSMTPEPTPSPTESPTEPAESPSPEPSETTPGAEETTPATEEPPSEPTGQGGAASADDPSETTAQDGGVPQPVPSPAQWA